MTAVSIEHDPPVNSDTLLYKILVELGLPRDQAEAVARMPCSAKRFYCDDQGELTEITLQHLDLRGRIPKELVPERVDNVTVTGLVVMGNMLGSGYELASSWILPEEKQSFLYYSHEVWQSNWHVLCGFLLLLLLAAVCRPRQRLQKTLRSLEVSTTAPVASANFGLLKTAQATLLLATPLLFIYLCSESYYDCSPPLWQTTSANLQAEPLADFCVIACWCAMLVLFRTIIASMPASRRVQSERYGSMGGFTWAYLFLRARRFLVWLLWFGVVTVFSLPSVLYAFANSLPAHNTSGINDAMLNFIHRTAPVLTVLIDMVLVVRISTKYSRLTGIKADRLVMTFRLFAAWLLPLLITVILDENCISGWKWTWTVCQAESAQHRIFDWTIYNEEILNTQRDICNLSETWWSDGRCSRAIVGNLTPFLLKKLLTRSFLQPLILLSLWRLSRLEDRRDGSKGRHLRFLGGPKGHPLQLLGVGRRTSGSLVPLQQMPFLTTLMELLMFWTPFVPLLSLGVLSASTVNMLIFDLGVWHFRVQLPDDEVNRAAGLSGSYLSFAQIAGSSLQLWHAFSSNMHGRSDDMFGGLGGKKEEKKEEDDQNEEEKPEDAAEGGGDDDGGGGDDEGDEEVLQVAKTRKINKEQFKKEVSERTTPPSRGDTEQERDHWSRPRRWQVRLWQVRVENMTDEAILVFGNFIFGGTKEEFLVRAGGKEPSIWVAGDEGVILRTPVVHDVPGDGEDTECDFDVSFEWHGSYLDLERQNLRLEIWNWARWRINKFDCFCEEPLLSFAKGPIQNEMECNKVDKFGKKQSRVKVAFKRLARKTPGRTGL
eukprot:g30169.t1